MFFYIALWAASITFATYIFIYFYLYYTARKSILSELIRQSAGYVQNKTSDSENFIGWDNQMFY